MGAGYSEDRLPSLLSLLPPSLPPAASGSRHLPPGPQPAGEAAVAAPATDLVLRRVHMKEPRSDGQKEKEGEGVEQGPLGLGMGARGS